MNTIQGSICIQISTVYACDIGQYINMILLNICLLLKKYMYSNISSICIHIRDVSVLDLICSQNKLGMYPYTIWGSNGGNVANIYIFQYETTHVYKRKGFDEYLYNGQNGDSNVNKENSIIAGLYVFKYSPVYVNKKQASVMADFYGNRFKYVWLICMGIVKQLCLITGTCFLWIPILKFEWAHNAKRFFLEINHI